jgi:uncharacterized RDD family membrane protein YckC
MSQPPDANQSQPGWGPPQGNYPPPAGGYGAPTPGPTGAAGNEYHDPASGLLLPQGTQLASVGRRIGAFFLAIPLSIITLGIGYIIWGLIVWGRGQTPALQVLRMRCYRPETGRVAGWGWMALREIIGRIVEGILAIITQLLSFVFFVSRGDRRSLHDLIAGTVVLHDPNKVLVGSRR